MAVQVVHGGKCVESNLKGCGCVLFDEICCRAGNVVQKGDVGAIEVGERVKAR